MRKNYLLYTFATVLLTLTFLDILAPDKEFSELENRNLKTEAKFSVDKFFDNSFQKNYETYTNDQFIFRDNWIDIKSMGEYALGKIENNGMIYGDEQYLFEKFNNYDNNRLSLNIESVNRFKEKIKADLSIMVVPSSYEIYKEYLPEGAPVINQEEKLEEVSSNLKGSNEVKVLEVMKANKEDYIYYRTDHHWTTYGAYLAYSEFMKSIGEKPVQMKDLKAVTIEDFYGTYFSKAKPFNIEPDLLTYYDIDGIDMDIYGEKYDSLYDYTQLEKRDKYALFLRGNNALTVIKNKELNNNKKILVIKDSFANSFVPFLTQNYEEVHVIDLRSFMEKVDKYVNDNEFDDVLILYNFINFARDVNVVKLKY